MINCKSCGRPNENHYRFCLGCGARLEHQKATRGPAAQPPEAETHSTSLAALSRSPEAEPEPEEPAAAPAPGGGVDRTCGKCGSTVRGGNLFCGKCGAPVARSSSTTAMHQPVRARAELILILSDGSMGPRIPLHRGERIIGREESFFAADPYISPRHAQFVTDEDGTVTLHDLESLNGVFMRLVEPTELHHGDQLRIGLELLTFQQGDKLPTLEPSRDGTRTMGSPKLGSWGRLERQASPTQCSHAYMLTQPRVTIGRDVGDIIFNKDAFVSGRHAALLHREGRFFVEDMGSSNGTFLRLRAPRLLKHGDVLLIGQQLIQFSVG